MPVQTTIKNILFPDGCKVSVKEYGAVAYTDIGAISSDVTASLSFDENQMETANAGTTAKHINNMKMEGAFTLINWDLGVIQKLSGGLLAITNTAAVANVGIPNQVIAAAWTDNTLYDLIAKTSSTNSTELKLDTKPTLTSVTLNHGTPETLVEGTDYFIVANANSSSGWQIGFISANMGSVDPKTYSITIVIGSNTPRASAALNAGESTVVLNPMVLKFEHTDGANKVRRLDLWSVDPNSGFLQFNFKGANSDGAEELPVTFMAKLDTARTSGQQLMTFTMDTGAL